MVQWLGLRASTERGTGSIPGRGTKILQAAWCGQKSHTRFAAEVQPQVDLYSPPKEGTPLSDAETARQRMALLVPA